MYDNKSIYCERCKKERWVGATCSDSKKNEKCVDKIFFNKKKDLKRLEKSS
jgi:hypothetical protein